MASTKTGPRGSGKKSRPKAPATTAARPPTGAEPTPKKKPKDDLMARFDAWLAQESLRKQAKKAKKAKPPAKARAIGGAPSVRDPNLRLALLDAMVRAGKAELPDLEPDDEYELDAGIRERLLATPLPKHGLAALTQLSWGGGHRVQHAIFSQWDGEGDEFDIRDLGGLDEVAPRLERLDLTNADVKDLAPLLRLPKLREARVGRYAAGATNRKVITELAKRGLQLAPSRA